MPKVMVLLADGVDVRLLVDRLGPDAPAPVLQDDVADDVAQAPGSSRRGRR